ncbi:MAG: GNAT family N-acetyltransferase [Candidatus Odinarchaeota archaeon]
MKSQEMIKTFRKALTSVYIENPCKTLPNALWKTVAKLEDYETAFDAENGRITKLEIKTSDSIRLYWHRENKLPSFTREQAEKLDFVIIHENFLEAFPMDLFTDRTPYFRLIHLGYSSPMVDLPDGFEFAVVDIEREVSDVVSFLKDCYPSWQFSLKQVLDWTKQNVYDPELWIWVIDELDDTPAALGIADIDLSIPEGSLEWIQVHPEYRGLGFGKNLVCELLDRLRTWVSFTTVSGEVNNPFNPEKLYRDCNFRGRDVWWVLRP